MSKHDTLLAFGIALGVLGGFLSVIDFSFVLTNIIAVIGQHIEWPYLIAWFVVGVAVAFLAIFGALLRYRGHMLGAYVTLISSLSSPLSFLLLMVPRPGSTIPLLRYHTFVVSPWLILSLIGAGLMLVAKEHLVPGADNQ